MSRPRKPTKLHVVSGTYRKDRHADRAGEPEVIEPLGDPPSGWRPTAKVLWHELAGQVPEGVATKADRVAFELLCRLVGKLRGDGVEALTGAAATQIRLVCGEFGMTPASRSKVSTPLPRALNPFGELDND